MIDAKPFGTDPLLGEVTTNGPEFPSTERDINSSVKAPPPERLSLTEHLNFNPLEYVGMCSPMVVVPFTRSDIRGNTRVFEVVEGHDLKIV